MLLGDGKRVWSWKRLWGVGAAAVIVILGARAWAQHSGKRAKESYRRVTVSRQELSITKTATGEATPQNRVEVKPPISGRVEQVLVREGDTVKQGQVVAWMSSEERAALLDAARAEGETSLARWESAYKAAPLMAPLDGTVIVRAVEPGQTVTTADPIVVIADRLIVKAHVDETDIGSIAVGQKAAITLDAYPDSSVEAHVDHVAYEATTVNNVTIYEVDVLPEAVPDFMRSGMTASITVTVLSKPDVLVLPAEAVKQGKDGTTVLLPGPNRWSRPTRAEITTGTTDGKWIEIGSGLNEGDTVLAPSLKLPRGSAKSQGRNPFSPFGARGGGGGGSRSRQ